VASFYRGFGFLPADVDLASHVLWFGGVIRVNAWRRDGTKAIDRISSTGWRLHL
jgi:hypothetical protein